MGVLIGAGANKPTFPYDYYYGVQFKIGAATTSWTRVGRTDLLASQPITSKFRRCLLADNGTVNQYLGDTDSTKTSGGATADLSGASGMVMVDTVADFYYQFSVLDDKITCQVLVSEYPLPGFKKFSRQFISAYQATVDRTNSKLASVVNATAQFRGGDNSESFDGAAGSLLGRPASVLNLSEFRTLARNRGAYGLNGCGWNCHLYEQQKMIFWLFAIEYASPNVQADYNAARDANGYLQGGLGKGVTEVDYTKWDTTNGVRPLVPCGVTNSLGNKTGYVNYTITYSDGTTLEVPVPSWHGIENPFGHIWMYTDGIKCLVPNSTDGGESKVYTCDNPANFSDDGDVSKYTYIGAMSRTNGYVSKIQFGESGDIMPLEINGSSTTYFCDYFWTYFTATSGLLRGVLFGGSADGGAYCGLLCANAESVPSARDVISALGFRFCLPTLNA